MKKKGVLTKRRELTKLEFILLLVLILVIQIYMSTQYILVPKWDKYNHNSEKLSKKTIICENLEKENLNKKKLIEKEQVLKYKLNKLSRNLPPYISQEDIILTLSEYSQLRGTNIEAITFDKDNIFTINNYFNKINDPKSQENNVAANEEESIPENSPIVITKFINVKFNGNLSAIYNFIDDLEKNQKKIVVKEIKIDKDKDKFLKGNMKLEYVGYKEDADIPEIKIDVPKIEGKTSPFKPYDGYKSEDGDENSKYSGVDCIPEGKIKSDIFLDINKSEDDMPKYIMGKIGRPDTEIYFNSKEQIKGKLVINKKENMYIYTYQLQNMTKEVSSKINSTDGVIRMKVNSSRVPSEDDKVSIILDIENKTDSELQISVEDEDIIMPRFILGKKTGKVTLK